jgi:hypothetical protein
MFRSSAAHISVEPPQLVLDLVFVFFGSMGTQVFNLHGFCDLILIAVREIGVVKVFRSLKIYSVVYHPDTP